MLYRVNVRLQRGRPKSGVRCRTASFLPYTTISLTIAVAKALTPVLR